MPLPGIKINIFLRKVSSRIKINVAVLATYEFKLFIHENFSTCY